MAFALAIMLTPCPLAVATWPAQAAAQAPADTPAPDLGALTAQEARDAQVVDAATQAANQRGAAALADSLPALERSWPIPPRPTARLTNAMA